VERRITLYVAPFFERRRLTAINKREVQQYIADRLDAGAKNVSISREYATLKRSFKLAEIPRALCLGCCGKTTRAGASSKPTSSPPYSPTARAAAFAAITGWRVPSEVLPLEWRHVDLRVGEVRLDPGATKNQDGRTFPLTDALRTVLTERKALTRHAEGEQGDLSVGVSSARQTDPRFP
jgi:integrase